MAKLTRKQNRTIPIVLSSATIEKGCAAAGISKSTFYRWMADPAFRIEFDRLMAQITNEAFTSIKQNLHEAVETLLLLLKSDYDTVKLSAANSLIEHHLRHSPPPQIQDTTGDITIRYVGACDLDTATIEELEAHLEALRAEMRDELLEGDDDAL